MNASTAVLASRCVRSRPYYEDDVPDQWSSYTQSNADFFSELGSPGGASKVGQTDNDPQAIKDLEPKGE